MSPQMKEILLSLKKTRFKQGTFQDSERNRVRSFKEDEKYLSISLSKESFQNGKIFLGNSREKEEYIQRESCTSSRGAVFQRRGSWIVPKHILSRSNTVAVLPLQKPGATRCSSTSFEESDEVLRPEANWLLEIHSADKVKGNFEKRLKPTSASVTKKPSSSDLFQRHSLGQKHGGLKARLLVQFSREEQLTQRLRICGSIWQTRENSLSISGFPLRTADFTNFYPGSYNFGCRK